MSAYFISETTEQIMVKYGITSLLQKLISYAILHMKFQTNIHFLKKIAHQTHTDIT
jgi:hypothetical protein